MDIRPKANRENLERFSKLGLEGNPFRAMNLAELAHLYIDHGDPDCPSIGELAQSTRTAIQILAPRGGGKSLLLAKVSEELRRLGKQAELLYCPPKKRIRFQAPEPPVKVLLIDEAQRLGRRARTHVCNWISESPRRLLATSHEDLGGWLGPELFTVRLPRADFDMVARFFRTRIEAAGGDSKRIRLQPAAAEWLAKRAAGNLRWVELICYEVLQELQPSQEVVIDITLLEEARPRALDN